MGGAGRKEIAEMHIRICVSVISVLTWGGQGGRKHRHVQTYVCFSDFGAHMGRAARKEITEMHIRICVPLIAVRPWGGQVGRKSQECKDVCVLL